MQVNQVVLVLTLLVWFTLWRRTGNPASGSVAINQLENRPIKFTKYRLANGLRVVLAPDKRAPIVAINISFNAGSGKEDREQSGLASLVQNFLLQTLRPEPGRELKPFEGVV
jgi:zinc protease